jgi:hypothetical protein
VVNRIITMLLVLLVLPVLVSAEIYKYRDRNGVLRFTDNLTEVPVAQRENIEQYQEIKTTADTAEQTPANVSEKQAAQDPKAVEKELTDEKGVLDNDYSQLMEMRNNLEAAPQPSTPEEIAAHEKKIQDYNIQLKIYEVKQKAFRAKVEAYQKAAKE